MSLVLVIDDEQSFLTAMSLALSSYGHEVMTAENGEDGLLQIEKRRPDILFLDIMMPGIGGLETLNLLRQQRKHASIPVVMVSGVQPTMKKSEQKWDAFLHKPFTLADVISLIERFVR